MSLFILNILVIAFLNINNVQKPCQCQKFNPKTCRKNIENSVSFQFQFVLHVLILLLKVQNLTSIFADSFTLNGELFKGFRLHFGYMTCNLGQRFGPLGEYITCLTVEIFQLSGFSIVKDLTSILQIFRGFAKNIKSVSYVKCRLSSIV